KGSDAAHAPAPLPAGVTPIGATRKAPAAASKAPLLQFESVCAGYGGGTVLDGVDLTVNAGEVVALLGRNGVGKTTALRCDPTASTAWACRSCRRAAAFSRISPCRKT